jgi:hypothetical protein
VSPATVRQTADKATRTDKDAVVAAEQARFVRWWWLDDGYRMGLEGQFPAAQGAVIASALERAAELVPQLPKEVSGLGDEPLTAELEEQKRADALWALCSKQLATDQEPDRAAVVVHTEISSVLRQGQEGGAGAGPRPAPRRVPPSQLRLTPSVRAHRRGWKRLGHRTKLPGRASLAAPPALVSRPRLHLSGLW